jgi:ADP-heptose:LPS heptosyltransferase
MLRMTRKLQALRNKTRRIFAKIIFDYKNPVGLNRPIQHILVVRWDAKFGDSFVSSFFFREIKKLNQIKVSVLATTSLVEMHRDFFGADDVIETSKRPSYKKLTKIAKKFKDVDTVIHLTEEIKMRDLYLLHKIKPKNVFSLDDEVQMVNMKMGEATRGLSFQDKYSYILSCLGVENIDDQYIIPKKTNNYNMESYDVIVNTFGSTRYKSLSSERAVSILKSICIHLPNAKIGLLSSPTTLETAKEIIKTTAEKNVTLINNINSIYDVINAVAKSELVVSVDTAIVHIAVGLRKRLVAIYPENDKSFNPWIPHKNDNTEIILSQGDDGIVNVNNFKNAEMIEAIDRINSIRAINYCTSNVSNT